MAAGAPSAKIGAKVPHSASQSLAQERSQCGSVGIPDFGCDGVDVEAAAVEQGLRMLDTKILKPGKRRFAEYLLASALQ